MNKYARYERATFKDSSKFPKLKENKFTPSNDDKLIIGATKQEIAKFDRESLKSYCKGAFVTLIVFITALNLSGYFASTGS